MATNKQAILRYRTIDRCLRDLNRQWTWVELAEACAKEILNATGRVMTISQRTIKYDLRAMRSNEILGYYAPIDYDRKEKTYYYTDPKYRLSERPINQSETEVLKTAISMMGQFMELSETTGIYNIITKLEDRLDRREQSFERIIQFDHDPDAPGQRWLYKLYKSIKEQKAILIQYYPFGKKPSQRIVSPQLLKEYDGRWYLLAHDHRARGRRVFAIDRIKEITESLSAYVQLNPKDMRRYFDQVVGVSVLSGQKPTKIRLEVFGVQIEYFKTKPIHSSQTIISHDEESTIIEIEVIVNYELISELMSYRNTIKIVSPLTLRDEMQRELENVLRMYARVPRVSEKVD